MQNYQKMTNISFVTDAIPVRYIENRCTCYVYIAYRAYADLFKKAQGSVISNSNNIGLKFDRIVLQENASIIPIRFETTEP